MSFYIGLKAGCSENLVKIVRGRLCWNVGNEYLYNIEAGSRFDNLKSQNSMLDYSLQCVLNHFAENRFINQFRCG